MYTCKAPDGTTIGNYSAAKGFRSFNLTYQPPMVVPVVTMEYQSWFTFYNTSPYTVKIIWLQNPGSPIITPPTMVLPGLLF